MSEVYDPETGEISEPAGYADCRRCGGSGLFLGRTGKVRGSCFACDDRRKREARLAALPVAQPTPDQPAGWRPVCPRCGDTGEYVRDGRVVGPCYACDARAERARERVVSYEAAQAEINRTAPTPAKADGASDQDGPGVSITPAGAIVCTYTRPRSRESYGSTRWVIGGPEAAVRAEVDHTLAGLDGHCHYFKVRTPPFEIVPGWWRAVIWRSDAAGD